MKRKTLSLILLFIAVTVLPVSHLSATDNHHSQTGQQAIEPLAKADETLKNLLEGNHRFMSGQTMHKEHASKRTELVKGQSPSAIILSCSDSRVPPEIIFDQGLGDIFVVRVAGNVADPVELGSIEYAVEHLNVPLIIVLGHDSCGAVTAAVKGGKHEGNIRAIVRKIAPAVRRVKAQGKKSDELLNAAIIENAHMVASSLVRESSVIRHFVNEKKLRIVAAKYSLETGRVDILEPIKRGTGQAR